jgi:hypothetical protein
LTTSLNTSTIKKFVEGCIETKKLYIDGTHEASHNALITMTCNVVPSYHNDGGMKRRMMAVEHHSLFTNYKKDVDEAKNIFKTNKNLIDEIEEEKLQDAIVDILVEHAFKYTVEKKTP